MTGIVLVQKRTITGSRTKKQRGSLIRKLWKDMPPETSLLLIKDTSTDRPTRYLFYQRASRATWRLCMRLTESELEQLSCLTPRMFDGM